MGMTAARLRERRAAALRDAPPPRPIITEEQIQQKRHEENGALRAENAALKSRVAELEKQTADLQGELELATAPSAPVTQDQQTNQGKQKRRG